MRLKLTFVYLSLILCCATVCTATTAVTGHVARLDTTTPGTTAYVRFWLRGTRGNQPRITGTGAIAPQFSGSTFYVDLPADASGNISGTIYSTRNSTGTGAGDIEAGGSYTAVYYGMQIVNGGIPGPEIPVHARSGGTLDIANVSPISTLAVVTAPTGDTTYARLDGGNTPFSGAVSFGSTVKGSNINSVLYVGEGQYATIQAAITAACAISPSLPVVVPPGSYAQNTPFTLCDGITIRGSGRNDTTITTTLSSGSLFPLIDFHDVSLSDFSVVKSGSSGGTFLTCQYCQGLQVVRVNVSGSSSTFTDGLFFNSDANGSSIYNDFWAVKFESVISTNCIHATSTNAGKSVNSNRFFNVKCGPNSGATSLFIDSAATQPIAEWEFHGGEFTSGTTGINIATSQARDIFFYGPTVEGNSGTGYQVASGAYKVQCFGGTIDSNGTNVTDAGTSSLMDCNVAGTTQTMNLDAAGNLGVNGLGLGGAAATANGINFAAGTPALQIAGATQLKVTSSGVTGSNIPIVTSFTTSAATTDNVTVTGMTSSGHCVLQPTNSGAAGGIASVFVSAKTTNQITVTHTATANWNFDVMCTPN